MDKIDKIRQEIERRKVQYYEREMKAWDDNGEYGDEDCYFYQGKRKACEGLLSFLDTLSEEPDKSLEEAAKEYAEGPECTWVGTTALEEAFKAGAKWQKEQDTRDMFMSDNRHFNKVYELGKKDMKEQMLKDAVEGTVIKTDKHTSVRYESYYGTDRYFYGIADKQFKAGDKVRIIILKAEEE